MSEKEMSPADRAKEILVRWMGGANLDTAAMEVEQLVNEYVAHATSKAYEDGFNSAIGAAHWTETWRGIE